MSNIISTVGMLPKETTGMAMAFIKLKSEINLIKLLKLLVGIWKKEEFRKILKLVRLDLDYSILLGLYHIVGELIKPSSELLLLDIKELINISLLPLKIPSMTMFTLDIKDIFNKEMMLSMLSVSLEIIHQKISTGEVMNLNNSTAEENL